MMIRALSRCRGHPSLASSRNASLLARSTAHAPQLRAALAQGPRLHSTLPAAFGVPARPRSPCGPAASGVVGRRTLFSFFSNSEFYKRCSHEGEHPAPIEELERDSELGAFKSKQKHDRHDAVTVDTVEKQSILLEGSTRVVLTAMASNLCLMTMKFFAAFSTNSPSMFAEGIHSGADLINECLLFFGVMRASRKPDSLHPYGFSRERYAWSLVSGCGIFFLGGGVSMYHGISGLLDPHMAEDLHIAFAVLAGSTLFEGGTALVAYRQVRKAAGEAGMSVLEYVKKGADPTAVQILLEDAAAISGVGVASACLGMSYYTGNPMYDAIGSISIGAILGTTAIFLIRRNMSMLVETSMAPHRETLVITTLLSDPVVKSVHDVKSTAIGIDGARFKAEVQFDGQLVASRAIRELDLDRELDAVRAIASKDELDAYLRAHGERVVDQLAEEVDRLEIRIKKTVPEVKHCDLEIL
ncbi:hypothetical protein H9P43_000343 [Blastocladiella emersonii ATCC 22665]|nr:hypothetical protein H9P43_000343 [Blastocladiella emersonii ATCC 22665]